jgi:hypothetical protein
VGSGVGTADGSGVGSDDGSGVGVCVGTGVGKRVGNCCAKKRETDRTVREQEAPQEDEIDALRVPSLIEA